MPPFSVFFRNGSVTFVIFIHIYRKYHISMHFLRKIIFHFPSKENLSHFQEKRNTIFQDITKNTTPQHDFFGKTIFSKHLRKISYLHVFFWEISSFNFRLKNKIIFSGWSSIVFPDNTRKIIFQCNFFGKNIFSEHVEKEIMQWYNSIESRLAWQTSRTRMKRSHRRPSILTLDWMLVYTTLIM